MKNKPSKLDQHHDRLMEWYADPKTTHKGVVKRLADECGLSVSVGQVCKWYQRAQQEQLQERVLASITNGSQMVSDIERQFGETPPPETATLVKFFRVLILQLAAQGSVDNELLDLVSPMMKQVLAFETNEAKLAALKLDERRVVMLEQNMADAKAKLTAAITASKGGLTEESLQLIEQAARIL